VADVSWLRCPVCLLPEVWPMCLGPFGDRACPHIFWHGTPSATELVWAAPVAESGDLVPGTYTVEGAMASGMNTIQ